jgi:hypothetical protein
MRWNLVWYVPLVAVSLFVAALDAVGAMNGAWFILTGWKWVFLISPAAAFWSSAAFTSVVAPLGPVLSIPRIFSSMHGRERYFEAGFGLLIATLSLLVSLAVLWGSFDYCPDGAHLRFIPFLPRPCTRPL